MKYLVNFIYNDSKELKINIEQSKLQEFFSCLDKKQIYWADESEATGFWLDLKNIRCIQLSKIEETQNEPKEETNPGESIIPFEDDEDSEAEGSSNSE